jgi:hypothetical protein
VFDLQGGGEVLGNVSLQLTRNAVKQLARVCAACSQSYPQSEWTGSKALSNQELAALCPTELEL